MPKKAESDVGFSSSVSAGASCSTSASYAVNAATRLGSSGVYDDARLAAWSEVGRPFSLFGALCGPPRREATSGPSFCASIATFISGSLRSESWQRCQNDSLTSSYITRVEMWSFARFEICHWR